MGNAASTTPDAEEETDNSEIINENPIILENDTPFNITSPSSLNFPFPRPGPDQIIVSDISPQPSKTLPPDGYKWRKYGQKNVRTSKSPRSYYKCTYPGCKAKKYSERIEDSNGRMIDSISYHGEDHNHDPSRITKIATSASNVETLNDVNISNAVNLANNSVRIDSSISDRPAYSETDSAIYALQAGEVIPSKDPSNVSLPSINQIRPFSSTAPVSTPKVVYETNVEVEVLDDGYCWRKYGQKRVKGAQHARSYYRCTEDSCKVKKTVEMKGDMMHHIYEGTHNHPPPPADDIANKKKRKKPNRTALSDVAEATNKRLRKEKESAAQELSIQREHLSDTEEDHQKHLSNQTEIPMIDHISPIELTSITRINSAPDAISQVLPSDHNSEHVEEAKS